MQKSTLRFGVPPEIKKIGWSEKLRIKINSAYKWLLVKIKDPTKDTHAEMNIVEIGVTQSIKRTMTEHLSQTKGDIDGKSLGIFRSDSTLRKFIH